MRLPYIWIFSLSLLVATLWEAHLIDGLTVRVNLLEARIHWQETPPSGNTTSTSDPVITCGSATATTTPNGLCK